MKEVLANERVVEAWHAWAEIARQRCHLHFKLEGGCLENHIEACATSAAATVSRVTEDIGNLNPRVILEIGCSVGFVSLALSRRFPEAIVVGLEPDREAVSVAKAMALEAGAKKVGFIIGFGEELPFRTSSVDLIICHTVIEHVRNVSDCIAEIARTLSSRGICHLEAPNYLWPLEPHLGIVVPPLCPKPVMRLLARLEGAGRNVSYVDHLKLVHPFWLERAFRQNGLTYENRMRKKLLAIARANGENAKAYTRLAQWLRVLQRVGLAQVIGNAALSVGIYPSVLYTLRRCSAQ